VTTRPAVPAIVLEITARAAAARRCVRAWILGAACGAAALTGDARRETNAAAAQLITRASLPAATAVRAIGAEVEAFVDMPIAVFVLRVARLADRWTFTHAAETATHTFDAVQATCAARAEAAHQRAGAAAPFKLIDSTVAVIVRAWILTRLFARSHALAAHAKLARFARSGPGFARAHAHRPVRTVVTTDRPSAARALLFEHCARRLTISQLRCRLGRARLPGLLRRRGTRGSFARDF